MMLRRAKEFKEAIRTAGGEYKSGVYIYRKTINDSQYADNPEKLAARAALLGFTDVYLGASTLIRNKEKKQLEWVRRFNTAAHKYGLKVEVLNFSNTKYLYASPPPVARFTDEVEDYNNSVKVAERFDGLSADLEPHIMKKGHPERPANLLYEWDGENGWGKGKDNEMLQKLTLDAIASARKYLGNKLLFNQAIGSFVQKRYDKGETKWGSAHQYLKYCNWLIIMAYNYKPESVFSMSEPTLINAEEFPKSISIAIKTSLDTYGSEGPVTSFMPQGWDYMINGISYIIDKASAYPSFRGLDIFEWKGFEEMWDGTAVADGRTNYVKPTYE